MIGDVIHREDPGLNVCTINGLVSPGRLRVSGFAQILNWEVRPGYGMTGATTVFRGRGLTPGTLLFEFWNQDQIDEWFVFSKVFDVPQKPLGTRLALGIAHPILKAIGVETIVMTKMHQIEINQNGLWSVSVEVLEYKAPIKAIVKPRGAVPAVDLGGTQAKTENQIALAQVTEEAKRWRDAANGPPGTPAPGVP